MSVTGVLVIGTWLLSAFLHDDDTPVDQDEEDLWWWAIR